MKSHRVYYNEINPQMAAWLRELIKDGLIANGEVDERSIEDIVPRELAEFTQCHFFAGIGVWSYALRQAGWPDDRPVWTGSCPCQPFSAAGERAGFVDDRHLWPAFYHLIAVNRPDVVFGEQVASKDGLAWLNVVQSDLEAAAYDVGALDLCAAGFGAPHIRQRLFFVAHSKGAKQQGAKPEKRRPLGYSAISGMGNTNGAGLAEWQSEREDDEPQCPPAQRTSGATGGFWGNAEWIYCQDGKRRPAEPSIFPLANGTTRGLVQGGDQSMALEAKTMRLSGYGNAIVAPVATEFIRAYMEIIFDQAIKPLNTNGGDRKSEQAKSVLHCNTDKQGNSVEYLAARLKRDHEGIYERLQAGGYTSVRRAAIDAGIVHEVSMLEKTKRLWLKLTPQEQENFQIWIEENKEL